MEIKKREILVSLIIAFIMLIVGIFISGKINDVGDSKQETYQKAIQIEEPELFRYCMSVNSGNGLIYGELKAIDTVSDPNIDGEWMDLYIETQKYTMHTRTVSNGKSSHTETYWTWDTIDSESKHCETISFCGSEFQRSKIDTPESHYIDTVDTGYHLREKFFGVDSVHTGTIFTNMSDGTISEHSIFYKNESPKEVVKSIEDGGFWWIVMFWIFWIILTGFAMYGFCYLQNNWLD